MTNLCNPALIRQVMSRHGVRFSKALGQNFIINPEICPKIAELGGAGKGIGALEIGPGIGVLTAELARRCEKVAAVEIDRRLLPVLGETLSGFSNIEIICADIMEINVKELINRCFTGLDVVICANLPYYITSPVVMRLLESRLPVSSITVMVQKEAAERICAELPSRAAGAVTVATRWFCEPELLFEVPPDSFMPPPDVNSAVIRLNILDKPPVCVKSEDMFFKVVKASFSQRRKTILNSLSSGLSIDKAKTGAILEKAGISHTARAEQLKLEEFAAISDLV